MTDSDARRRDDNLRLWAPALVVLLTFVVFSGGLANGFVNWDDRQGLVGNQSWRGLGWTNIKWMLTTFDLGHYQPLSWLSLGLDYELWGLSAFGIHLTSLLLHCGCALIAYFIGLRLLKDPAAAAAAALLFSLHPLRVESIAWAAQRRDPLSTIFYLWTLLCWLDGRRRGALVCAFLSLSAKLTGLTLPVVLLLLDIYPLGRLSPDWRQWHKPAARGIFLEKMPFAALALIFLMVNVFAQVSIATMPTLGQFGLAPRLSNSLYSLVFYLGKTLWPADLSPLYYGGSASARLTLWIGGGAALVIAMGFRYPRLRPALAASCAFYVMTLIPYLGLVKSGRQIAADRYTYIACLPWALLVAAGLASRGRKALAAGTGVLLLALGAASVKQTALWHDSLSLWRRALAVEPMSDTPRPILAIALMERGRADEAMLYLKEQVNLFPGDFESRKMLLELAGKDGVSVAEHARIHKNLGREYFALGERDKAAWHFRRARMYAEAARVPHKTQSRPLSKDP